MHIICFGDIHMECGNLTRIPGISDADLVVVTGDITNFGGPEEAAAILQEIRRLNPALLALAGNLDQPEVEAFLAKEDVALDGRGRRMGETGIFGVGGSNLTPFATPNERSEEQIEKILARAHQDVAGAGCRILISHTPPHATNCDRLNDGAHVGSTAIRKFIEKQEPELCICGHIHEARATDRIGKTRIINPGMLQAGGWVDIRIEAGGATADLNRL